MSDNKSAFSSNDYNRKIKQTLPYYDEFYKQITELVNTVFPDPVKWLDIGCGTGKMGSVAFQNVKIRQFIFCDSSYEMISIAKDRFNCPCAEFALCDVQDITYTNEFDVITAIQVNHYLHMNERKTALQKCYEALKNNGLYICFENFAPFTDFGKTVYLEKWKRYQIEQGKNHKECDKHIKRYEKDYFPVSLSCSMELMQNCGFKSVEILWLSNMQAGFWGMK